MSLPWRRRGASPSRGRIRLHRLLAELQRQRRFEVARAEEVQFHDRSPICTVALAAYLGHPFPDALSRELKRVHREAIYQKRVFFIQNLGFITPTEARRIGVEDALRFERVHESTYRDFGFELVPVAAGILSDRVDTIVRSVQAEVERAPIERARH